MSDDERQDDSSPTKPARRSARVRGPGRRLRGAVANKLGTAILTGEYAPGDILPGEVVAAEELEVSRGAYREAMQVLAAKGLVESRPKTGTKVLPRERWNLLDPEVLSWAFAGTPDARLVKSLFELRLVIEPAAAAFAAQRRSQADLKQMRDALTSMRRNSLTTAEGRAADRDFHDALLRATKNDALIAISASIGAAVSLTTHFKQRRRQLPRDPIPDHARVLDAIAEGDPDEAADAMRVLVELALEDTNVALARGEPATDAEAIDAD
ncbi:HTH-type transcriptional regulator LutR [Croceibacterium atlanticum]|uniref:HTH-type transcriptional regulator LutR n=1 Tax=Croceibacterium atlanticum TaxID=1267766 RepID=A0A0F7KVH0_9SPHN|nr:FadR/GntR family transcriptional regulator [Croceibacterium atlanticum]AKH43232.1 HTH-type transcriptional regulator LutR [Croceibacterium atlanticum]